MDDKAEGPETTARQESPGEKLDVAIEYAFNTLIKKALEDELLPPVLRGAVMGLMYLPDQKVTQQFKDACKAVIDCLVAEVPKDNVGGEQ